MTISLRVLACVFCVMIAAMSEDRTVSLVFMGASVVAAGAYYFKRDEPM